MAQTVKNAQNAGDPSSIPGRENPLEKGMATHFSVLAWRIPWPEEPGGLQSMRSQPERLTLRFCVFNRCFLRPFYLLGPVLSTLNTIVLRF